MTDRERLIDLIIEAKKTDPETGSFTDYLADYLIEHGIIVPPCKAEDTLYEKQLQQITESKEEWDRDFLLEK